MGAHSRRADGLGHREGQKCGGEGNFSETAVHWPRLAAQTPRLSEGDSRRLNRPKCAHRTGIRTCEGFFASARVKRSLNYVGPITAAHALELFLSLFAGQLASTKKVHVMLLMGSQ